MMGGKIDGENRFCSNECLTNFKHPGFCQYCVSETTNDASGNLRTFNGIGLRLYGGKNECPICFSTVRKKWFCVVYIPLIPGASYRIKYNTRRVFFSRKTKPELANELEMRPRAGTPTK
jgi:hypothetical protein